MAKLLRLRYVLLLGAAALGVWMGLYPVDWQTWLGFSRADYFVHGQNYAFTSGPGPMIETAALGAGVLATLLRHLNCHVAGCPRINRHKIANGEYGVCGRHWRQVSGHPADHKVTVEHLRERHHRHLKATGQQ